MKSPRMVRRERKARRRHFRLVAREELRRIRAEREQRLAGRGSPETDRVKA